MEEKVVITPEQEKNEVVKALAEAIAEDAKRGRNITIRTGEALEQKPPRTVNIAGVINTPYEWLNKRKDNIDQKQCYVIVSREEMGIGLFLNEHDHYQDIVKGRLIISPEFKKFGINEGNYITGMQLSDLIRMNRSFFADRNKAAELVTIMRNFKATVTTQLEASDDKKGNTAQVRRQTVEGNQPPSFELCIPIFKGLPKRTFTVEIDIDPDTLQATLVSPEAQELIDDMRDELMDSVLEDIIKLCPDIPIIEV